MALHPPESSDKLIFAPAGSTMNSQAAQFTRNPPLRRADLHMESPIAQFHAWFSEAQASGQVPHPETCCMSTSTLPSGRISSRMVYMKELDPKGGFVVYSNYGTSRKAADLGTNPFVSLVFWWEGMQRQIRVEGKSERIPAEESQRYYETRIRGSRIGAWASKQSVVLKPLKDDNKQESGSAESTKVADDDDDGRKQLEYWVQEAHDRFNGTEDIPVPPFWGGLRIIPDKVEFWQGRESRLHDRFLYELDEKSGSWSLERLSP